MPLGFIIAMAGMFVASIASVVGYFASEGAPEYSNSVSAGALLILGALGSVMALAVGIYFGLTKTLREVIEARGMRIEQLEADEREWLQERASLTARIEVLEAQPNLISHRDLLETVVSSMNTLTKVQAAILDQLKSHQEGTTERQRALLEAINSHIRHPGSRTRGARHPHEGEHGTGEGEGEAG